MPRLLIASLLVAAACKKAPPDANPEFSDAAVFTFVQFEGPEVELAFALRDLERQVYLSMDVEADKSQDRALTPSPLTEEDVANIPRPDRDPAEALPVAVAGLSAFGVDQSKWIQDLEDHTPVEPYSPEHYDRTFLEGRDCWFERSCPLLVTDNELTKDNFLMTVPYEFKKNFRWVDMNLPDPADVPEGEEPVSDSPRWAYVGRSWTEQVFTGTSGNSHIMQSYTIEIWIPRDGEGFVRDGTEQNVDGGEWTSDSTGGGTLRMLALWAETKFDGVSFDEDLVASTTRKGIDDNFQAAETWLEENAQ